MEHKNISRLLILAGGIAVLGILFVFYLSTPLRVALNPAAGFPWLYVIFKAIAGLPYLLALASYFGICRRIGNDKSFCPENVRDMNRITLHMLISSLVWLVSIAVLPAIANETAFPVYVLVCAAALAMMASLAVALVAKMMAHLVNRAVVLQEDSDLTI